MIMGRSSKILSCAVIAAAVFSPAAGRARAAGAPPPAKIEKIFYLPPGDRGLQSFRDHASQIDVVAPQSYEVDSSFTLQGAISPAVLQAASAQGVKVMPLVVNSGFRERIMHRLLLSPAAQNKIIKSLVAIARRLGWIGWQFDFEHMRYTDRGRYTAFVRRAARAFHAGGLILSVAVSSRTGDDASTDAYKEWGGVFDYPKLAAAADFLSLMAYDDPNSRGPSASLPYAEQALDYILKQVPAAKISLGVPLYYWSWQIYPSERVRAGGTYARVDYLRRTYPHGEGFDATLGVPWLIYSDGRQWYAVWFENAESFGLKLAAAESRGLRGISAWALGFEDPGIWGVLAGR